MSINGSSPLIPDAKKGLLRRLPSDILSHILSFLNPEYLEKFLSVARLLGKGNPSLTKFLEESIYKKLLDQCFPFWRNMSPKDQLEPRLVLKAEYKMLLRDDFSDLESFWHPYRLSALSGNLEKIEKIKIEKINGSTPQNKKFLYCLAISNGHFLALKKLAGHGQDRMKMIAFFRAAKYGQLAVVQYMLEHEKNVSRHCDAALSSAASNKQLNIVWYFLLEKRPLVSNEVISSVFFSGVKNSQLTLVQYLLGNEQIHVSDAVKGAALRAAAAQGHFSILQCLLEQKKYINLPEWKGVALCEAACHGDLPVVEYLHEKQYQFIPEESKFKTLNEALHCRRLNIVTYLLEHFAFTDVQISNALATTIKCNNPQMSNILIAHCHTKQIDVSNITKKISSNEKPIIRSEISARELDNIKELRLLFSTWALSPNPASTTVPPDQDGDKQKLEDSLKDSLEDSIEDLSKDSLEDSSEEEPEQKSYKPFKRS